MFNFARLLVAPGHRRGECQRPQQAAGRGVWSALEYGFHSAFVLPILGHEIEVMLAHDRAGVHDPCPEIDIEDATRLLTLDPESILDDLEREGASLGRLVNSSQDGWDHVGLMDDRTWWQAEATLLHAAHDTTHHLLDVGKGLVRIAGAVPTAESRVDPVNAPIAVSPSRRSSPLQCRWEFARGQGHSAPPFEAVCPMVD